MRKLSRYFIVLVAMLALLLAACTPPPTATPTTGAAAPNTGTTPTSAAATTPTGGAATTPTTASTGSATATTTSGTPTAGTGTTPTTGTGTTPTAGTGTTPTTSTGAKPTTGGGTLTVGNIFDLKTLDPHRAYEFTAATLMHNMYDTLVTFNGADVSKVVPSIADSWTSSDDVKTYTFKIHNGAKFSSGNPVTAEDVRFSLQRLINIKGNAAGIADNIDKVTAPDANTVVIALKQPDPALLPLLTSPWMSIVDSKVVKQNGGTDAADADKTDKAESFFSKNSAGSGPFVLKSYTPDSQVTLERNPNAWHNVPKVERVVINNVPEASSQKLSVEKGDIDIATDLTNDQIADSQTKQGIAVVTGKPLDFIYMAMNESQDVGKELGKPEVQQAIRMAIDYDGLVKLAGGGAIRLNGLVPHGLLGDLDQSALTKTDPEGAKSLLAKAGYANGITFKLSYPTKQVYDGVPMDAVAEKLQADLKKANITVDLNPMEESPLLDSYRNGKEQCIIIIWGYDLPDPSNSLLFAPPDGVIAKRVNWTQTVPEIDALIKGDLNSKDSAKRGAAYQQYQKIMLEKSPYAVLFQPGHQLVTRSNVQGVTYNPVWTLDFASITK